MDEFFTPQQFAIEAHTTPHTVRRWLREGRIVGRRFEGRWRIPKEELAKVLPSEDKRAICKERLAKEGKTLDNLIDRAIELYLKGELKLTEK